MLVGYLIVCVIRLLISCRVEIAGEAAALQYRRQLVDEFLSERTAKQRSAAQLKSIRDRIQNFMALSVSYIMVCSFCGASKVDVLCSKRNSLLFSFL